MQRDAHGVEPGRLDEANVLLADVDVAKLAPESRRLLRTNQGLDHVPDLARRARPLEIEHVAFGHQPIAEVDTLDGKAGAVTVDQMGPVGMDEIAGRGRRGPGPEHEAQSKERPTDHAETVPGSFGARPHLLAIPRVALKSNQDEICRR